jgi:DNA-directed RNA polymerase subunit RPC12/RpoP
MPYHQINCPACGLKHLIQFKHQYENVEVLPESMPERKPKRRLIYKGICSRLQIEVYKDTAETFKIGPLD